VLAALAGPAHPPERFVPAPPRDGSGALVGQPAGAGARLQAAAGVQHISGDGRCTVATPQASFRTGATASPAGMVAAIWRA
jgi:copper oxidase (laccase) domain-containing protein